MIISRKTFLTAVMAAAGTISFAQTQTFDGVKSINYSTIAPIFEKNEVRGYTTFWKVDKADKKNDNYSIVLYDQDLTKVSSINLQKPRDKFFLFHNAFNGNAFGYYFYNHKDKCFEIETYDTGLKKLGAIQIKEMSMVDKQMVGQTIASSDESSHSGLSLYPVEGKGFIRNSFVGMGKGYKLEMFDNNLKTKWKFATPEKSKVYETIGIYDVTDKYVISAVVQRNGMMSKKMDFFLVVFDVETGKKIVEQNLEKDPTQQLSLTSVNYEKDKGEIVVTGEYYKLKDKPGVNKSLGFFVKRFDERGKELGFYSYAWDGEFRTKLPEEAKQSIEKNYINYTHNIFKGQDGKIYVVAEQYKIVADAFGIADKVLSGGRSASSVTKGSIGNMLVFVLNPDYTLNEVKFYEKDKSVCYLPSGSDFAGAGMVGGIIKKLGQFDYQFSQKSNDGQSFNVVYINYDKEKGEQKKKVIGNITMKNNGTFTLDKIEGNAKASKSLLYPAKPGYLMMVDHLKKEKQLGMKLVKINS